MADFSKLIGFTKKKEGGLSRATTDSASKNPSPCIINGQSGWHTNKGITWTAFKANSDSLGYEASCDNFQKMPDKIWTAIYKTGYWDPFSLDKINSQPIADMIVSWAWGSGIGGAGKQLREFFENHYKIEVKNNKDIAEAFNELIKKKGEKQVYDRLRSDYEDFLRGLNQPANLNGWLARLNELYEYGLTMIGVKAVMKHWKGILIIVGVAAAFAGVIYTLTRDKKEAQN